MNLFQDQDFISFFDRTTRIVERMLCEPKSDYLADYTGESGNLYLILKKSCLMKIFLKTIFPANPLIFYLIKC